jgi:lipopolysaccharide/colanic/teichoic acid biosynthesis glycosyltransferase
MRIAERFAATLALLACAPLIASAAIAVRVLSGRSPFVAHRRVGLDGAQFWMLKLRTMWGDSERCASGAFLVEHLSGTSVPQVKRLGDHRVTNVFALMLRKYSIDELPQLLHVITGKMALVGPRPLTRSELDTHYGDAAREILRVRPGMTGLWQVLGRNRLTYTQRRRLDLFFVHNSSARLYATILLRTPGRVLTARDAF